MKLTRAEARRIAVAIEDVIFDDREGDYGDTDTYEFLKERAYFLNQLDAAFACVPRAGADEDELELTPWATVSLVKCLRALLAGYAPTVDWLLCPGALRTVSHADQLDDYLAVLEVARKVFAKAAEIVEDVNQICGDADD